MWTAVETGRGCSLSWYSPSHTSGWRTFSFTYIQIHLYIHKFTYRYNHDSFIHYRRLFVFFGFFEIICNDNIAIWKSLCYREEIDSIVTILKCKTSNCWIARVEISMVTSISFGIKVNVLYWNFKFEISLGLL